MTFAGVEAGAGAGDRNSDLTGAGGAAGLGSDCGNSNFVGASAVFAEAADWGWKKLGISVFLGGENIVVSSVSALCPNANVGGAACVVSAFLLSPKLNVVPLACAGRANAKVEGADCTVVVLEFAPKLGVASLACAGCPKANGVDGVCGCSLLAFEPKLNVDPPVCAGCPNENVGADGAGCVVAVLLLEPKLNVDPLACEGCVKENVEGALGAGCAACVLFEPKLNVEPFVCAGCVNEKVEGALGAGCVASVIFEPKPNAGVLFVCAGCPNVKLDGADWEVFCPKIDGVEAGAGSCPKLIWLCWAPNVKDELGGVNVDCCDWPNGLGEGMLLKLAPAALFPLAPSLDFGFRILWEKVSGVIRSRRHREGRRESIRVWDDLLPSRNLSLSRHGAGPTRGGVVVVWSRTSIFRDVFFGSSLCHCLSDWNSIEERAERDSVESLDC